MISGTFGIYDSKLFLDGLACLPSVISKLKSADRDSPRVATGSLKFRYISMSIVDGYLYTNLITSHVALSSCVRVVRDFLRGDTNDRPTAEWFIEVGQMKKLISWLKLDDVNQLQVEVSDASLMFIRGDNQAISIPYSSTFDSPYIYGISSVMRNLYDPDGTTQLKVRNPPKKEKKEKKGKDNKLLKTDVKVKSKILSACADFLDKIQKSAYGYVTTNIVMALDPTEPIFMYVPADDEKVHRAFAIFIGVR